MIASLLRQATIIGKLRYFFLDRYYNRTLRVVLVGFCILMTLVSTFLLRDAYGMTKMIVGFAPVLVVAGLAGFFIVYYNMHLLPGALLIITILLHTGIGTGTGTMITFTFLLLNAWAVLWLFKMFVVERKVEVRPTPSNIFALLFMVGVIISFFWSYAYVERNVKFVFDGKAFPRIMTTIVLLISPGTFFLFVNHIRSMKMIRFFSWTWIWLGAVMVIFHFVGLGDIPILNTKAQFPTWVGGMALGQVLFNHQLKWKMRIVLLAILGAWLFVQFVQGISWLSGWLPLALVCGILVFFYSRRLFLVLLICAGTYYVTQKAFVTSTLDEESTVSGETRLGAWDQVLLLTSRHYLFGTGPAGYQFYFSTYQGYMYQLSHNNYIDILAQTGVYGFTMFIAFWLTTSYTALKLFFILPRKNDFVHGLGYTLIAFNVAIYAIMMLGDWITPFPYTQGLAGIDYDIWPWMMTGLTAAFYYMIKDEQDKNIHPVLATKQ